MFVNKINGVSNIGFKAYQHVKNNVGETIMRFNYPYDSDKENCEIHIYKAVPTEKYDYKLSEKPIAVINLKPEGVDVNLQDITSLDKDAPFAYKVVRKDKSTGNVIWEGADTGVKIKPQNGEYVNRVFVHNQEIVEQKDSSGKVVNVYEDFTGDPISNYTHTLVSRKGTTPIVQGSGYLITPDSLMPGARYAGFDENNTGEILYDKDYQKIKKKREKEREKTNKQRAEVGMPPDEEKIHMSATIEYIKEGNYYLLKYERGTIRAWGAIKSL